MTTNNEQSTAECNYRKSYEDLLRASLAGDPSAVGIEQWIFWNNSPSRHVPVASLTKFFSEAFFSLLAEDHRVRSHVDRLLKSKFSWKESVAWTPDDSLWEVSLIEPISLERLSLLAGAIALRKIIAQIIDGSIVRKLRQEIGEDIMEFTLLSSSSSKYFLGSVEAPSEDLVAAIKKEGIMVVETAFSAKPIGVQERIASKLPGCFANQFYHEPLPLAEAAGKILNQLWKEASSWL
ncbi:MAG: SctK family type III secretion system sorting platform protein [Chthoniobacterales bacterium]